MNNLDWHFYCDDEESFQVEHYFSSNSRNILCQRQSALNNQLFTPLFAAQPSGLSAYHPSGQLVELLLKITLNAHEPPDPGSTSTSNTSLSIHLPADADATLDFDEVLGLDEVLGIELKLGFDD
ncbi:hypothetical protein ACHAXM_005598 [Skeletonema potamos]